MSKQSKTILTRIGFDIILVLTVFFLPWWLTCLAVLAGMISFGWFFEGVALLLLVDTAFTAGWLPQLALVGLLGLLIIEYGMYYISRP